MHQFLQVIDRMTVFSVSWDSTLFLCRKIMDREGELRKKETHQRRMLAWVFSSNTFLVVWRMLQKALVV